jgi:hypothetical protein
MQKYGESTNDSNYNGGCTLHRFRLGTFKTFKQLNICWSGCKNTYRTENCLDKCGCGPIEELSSSVWWDWGKLGKLRSGILRLYLSSCPSWMKVSSGLEWPQRTTVITKKFARTCDFGYGVYPPPPPKKKVFRLTNQRKSKNCEEVTKTSLQYHHKCASEHTQDTLERLRTYMDIGWTKAEATGRSQSATCNVN